MQVKEAVAAPARGRKGATCPEALQCVGVLAEALRGAWKPYAAALIEPMILTGLSPTLVMALQASIMMPWGSFACFLYLSCRACALFPCLSLGAGFAAIGRAHSKSRVEPGLLQEIVAALPELLGAIQGQLLDLLSLVLARRPHRDNISALHLNALHQAVTHGAPPLTPYRKSYTNPVAYTGTLLPHCKGDAA